MGMKRLFRGELTPGQWRLSGWAMIALALAGLGAIWVRGAFPQGPARSIRPRMIVVPPLDGKRFAIAETEVTQAQWVAVMGSNPSHFTGESGPGGPEHPVESVSWHDGVLYMNRLSELEGLTACYTVADCTLGQKSGCKVAVGHACDGYRYPTEPEWVWAASAGEGDLDLGGDLASLAWIGVRSTQAVGLKPANAWGVQDIVGNVHEWTSSTDVVGSSVVRGCSWDYDAAFCRAAERNAVPPADRVDFVGFRPVRSYPRSSNP